MIDGEMITCSRRRPGATTQVCRRLSIRVATALQYARSERVAGTETCRIISASGGSGKMGTLHNANGLGGRHARITSVPCGLGARYRTRRKIVLRLGERNVKRREDDRKGEGELEHVWFVRIDARDAEHLRHWEGSIYPLQPRKCGHHVRKFHHPSHNE